MYRKLIFIHMLMLCSLSAGAQTERRIYTKAEQESAQKHGNEKYIRAVQDSVRAAEALAALERLDFVLEANRLAFKRGSMAFVTSNTNFISLSDDKAVIQIAPFWRGGPNGVGGITLEGRASNIRLKTDKKGNITLTFNVLGTALSATIDVHVPLNSYTGSVTVTPNFHSNWVTLYGTLVPASESCVFKGKTL